MPTIAPITPDDQIQIILNNSGLSVSSLNGSQPDLPLSLTYEIWALTVVAPLLGILTLWTIVGNFLVLLSLQRYKRLRSTSNLLIGNLAVSDFLLSLTVMPMSSVTDLLGYWVFGQIMCNIWLSIDVLYCTASIWGLVAIAFDRFTATVFPVWYRDSSNNRRIISYAGLVWVLSILICLPPLIGWDGKRLENPRERFQKSYVFDNATQRHMCILFNEPNYVIYSAMGSFIIPLVVMIILYMKIFAVLQERATVLREKRKKATKIVLSATNGTHTTTEKSKSADETQFNSFKDPDVQVHIISTEILKPVWPPIELTPHRASTPETPDSPWELQKLCPNNNNTSTESGGESKQPQEQQQDSSRTPVKKKHKSRRLVRLGTNKMDKKQSGDKEKPEKDSQAKADRREQRATKRMALIIALFVLCWIPFTMMYMIRSLCGEQRCPDYLHLRMFVIWLGYANSGLNPILYTIFNEDFREAFGQLLCGKRWARQNGQRNKRR